MCRELTLSYDWSDVSVPAAARAHCHSQLTSLLPDTPHRTQLDYYLCGPPPLITQALTLLNQWNVPSPQIHTERFDLI